MKIVNYSLGAGPYVATRFEHAAGMIEITMFKGVIAGRGSTAKDAATHLADQLRELARLVEAHEGERHG